MLVQGQHERRVAASLLIILGVLCAVPGIGPSLLLDLLCLLVMLVIAGGMVILLASLPPVEGTPPSPPIEQLSAWTPVELLDTAICFFLAWQLLERPSA